MPEASLPAFLLGAAAIVLLMVAVGLVRVLRGPSDADRMMAAQLLGTGGIAALLLAGVATGLPGAVDLALVLALLAVFVAVVFARGLAAGADAPPSDAGSAASALGEPGLGEPGLGEPTLEPEP